MSCTSVEIDPGSGFCFGVVTAIRKAEEELDRGGTLYCLGDIVHNSDEVERLRQRGLVTISHDDLLTLPPGSRGGGGGHRETPPPPPPPHEPPGGREWQTRPPSRTGG
ncbi:MAG: hypothetical protein K2I58_07195, partial [Candidatus Amulumruptor sp.]|nr:hypothetical protein [Candidatus Amulumruptor sp.]